MDKIPGLAIGVSGFFLRADSWSRVADCFENFVCIDDYRDEERFSAVRYRDRIKKILESGTGPLVLVGHSFGACVALEVASSVPKVGGQLVLLGGLVPDHGETPFESYQASEQNTLTELCHLDFESGHIVLDQPRRFQKSLSSGGIDGFGVQCARAESIDLVVQAVRYKARHLDDWQVSYVVAQQDRFTSSMVQSAQCEKVAARKIAIAGGHTAALAAPMTWLEALGTEKRSVGGQGEPGEAQGSARGDQSKSGVNVAVVA